MFSLHASVLCMYLLEPLQVKLWTAVNYMWVVEIESRSSARAKDVFLIIKQPLQVPSQIGKLGGNEEEREGGRVSCNSLKTLAHCGQSDSCSLPDSRVRYKEMPTPQSKRRFHLVCPGRSCHTYKRFTRCQDYHGTGSLCLRVSGPGCLRTDTLR